MTRPLAAAALALLAASAATAQLPSGVRQVPTVSPVPAIVLQQEMAFRAAEREAYLWRLSQPPVIVINPYPTYPGPRWPGDWCGTADVMNGRHPFGGFGNGGNTLAAQPGALSVAATNLYRPTPAFTATLPALVRPAQPLNFGPVR